MNMIRHYRELLDIDGNFDAVLLNLKQVRSRYSPDACLEIEICSENYDISIHLIEVLPETPKELAIREAREAELEKWRVLRLAQVQIRAEKQTKINALQKELKELRGY
jgi:hypothetical protein